MPSLTTRLKAVKDRPTVEWTVRPEILLHPQLPKMMHTLAPRIVLGQKWWDETRRAAYASTDEHCAACGVAKVAASFRPILEAHEIYDIDYERGRLQYVEAVPLCVACHEYVHVGRLQWLLESGRIAQGRYVAVITHGDRVLQKAGLTKAQPPTDEDCADWSDWRLVVDGRLVPEKGLPKNCPPFDVWAKTRGLDTHWGEDEQGFKLCRSADWRRLTAGGRRRFQGLIIRGCQQMHDECRLEFPPLFRSYEDWVAFHRGKGGE